MDYSKLLSTAKLVLAVQAPTLEDCWSEGYDKSQCNTLDDNPYVVGTANYHHWEEGWWAGFYASTPDSETNDKIYFSGSASNDNSIKTESNLDIQSNLQTKRITNKIAFE